MTDNRTSHGSAIEHRGIWYAVLTLERGKRSARRHWERIPVEPGDPPLTRAEARRYAASLQARADAGWDPTAKTAPADTGVLVPAYVDTWLSTRTYDSAPKDRTTLARYLPTSPLANVRVADCKPRHIVAFIRWLKTHPSERGGCLAPRTVRSVYDVVRRAFDSAIVDEITTVNPCMRGAVSGELPAIEDKNPTEREGWEYSWDEIRPLCYDPRIPADRRMVNVLRFATGGRISELAVVRFRDWDRDVDPLTRITIRRARKSVSRTEGSTKTGAVKRVPVHPIVAGLLAAWWESGWEAHYGRAPTLDDYIVPTHTFAPRHENKANAQFKADCERVGVRVLSQHKARHSFVTRVQDDGADGDVIRWITHAPPRSAFDGYTRAQWSKLCAELSKLRFPLALTLALTPPVEKPETPRVFAALSWSGREDLKVSRNVSPRDSEPDSATSASRVETDSDPFRPLALTPATPAVRPELPGPLAALAALEAKEFYPQEMN